MKLLGIESRDVYIAVEYSQAELRNMHRFFEKALPLFFKVFGDTEDGLAGEIQQVNESLEKIFEQIKESD